MRIGVVGATGQVGTVMQAILEERGDAAEIVEYLKTNPSRADLERIVDAIASEPASDEPAALVRKDKRFGELGLDASDYVTKEQVVARCKELRLQPRYLSLPITQLTQDDITELEKRAQALQDKYTDLLGRTPESLWVDDLHSFVAVYKKTIGVNVKKEKY